MNYIEQIKGFWRSHEIEAFSTNAIALYFYLLEVNNTASWIVSFKRNNAKICADLSISYPTLNNARNRLKQAGILDFKTQSGNANVTYSLKNFLKVTNEVTNEVGSEVGNEVGSRLNKTKDKLNQTKLNRENTPNYENKVIPISQSPFTKNQVWECFTRTGGTKEMALAFWETMEGCGWNENGRIVRNLHMLQSRINRYATNWNKNNFKNENNSTNAKSSKDIQKGMEELQRQHDEWRQSVIGESSSAS